MLEDLFRINVNGIFFLKMELREKISLTIVVERLGEVLKIFKLGSKIIKSIDKPFNILPIYLASLALKHCFLSYFLCLFVVTKFT